MQAYQPSAAQSLSLCPAVYIMDASVGTARGIRSGQGIPGDLSLGGEQPRWTISAREPLTVAHGLQPRDHLSWRMVVGFGSGLVGWAVYTVVCSSRQAVLTDAPAKHARLWDGARHRLNGLFHNGGHKCTVHVLYRREGSTWAYDLTAVSCASDAVVSRSSGSGPITNFYPILWAIWSCCSRCWELEVYIVQPCMADYYMFGETVVVSSDETSTGSFHAKCNCYAPSFRAKRYYSGPSCVW